MNEKKPKWVCPVCNKPAYYEHLFLDGFYIQAALHNYNIIIPDLAARNCVLTDQLVLKVIIIIL